MTEDEKRDFVKAGKKRLKKVIDDTLMENLSATLLIELQKVYKEYYELKNKKEENEPVEDEE